MNSFLTPYDLSYSGQEKLQFAPFWAGPKPVCSDRLRAGVIKSRNFFVLGPILLKFHIRTRLIKSFRTIFRTWWCGEEKLHFTPVHTLRQLNSTTSEGSRVSSEVRLGNSPQVWGVGQIWRAWDSRLRKNRTSHLFWLVQTCPNPRTIQWRCTLVSQRHFCTFERSYSSVLRPLLLKLHIITRLIDSFPMVHGSWSCIEIENLMLISLGAHA